MVRVTLLVLASSLLLPVQGRSALIDFDAIAATCCFADVTPGVARGPLIAFPGASVDGGVVMYNSGWANQATTAPNVYGTSDFNALADGSFLPGFITILFNSVVSAVTLDIINGAGAADFTASAFDSGNFLLTSQTVT